MSTIAVKSDFQRRLEAGAESWSNRLTKDQKLTIKLAGLDTVKAYKAFRRYDINKLTMKEVASIARVAAMGLF